jgi:hypothetical protein
MVEALVNSSNANVPTKKFNPHLKPEWKSKLKPLHDEMFKKRQLWVTEGRPRDTACPWYQQYKDSKREFRKKLREVMAQDDRKMFDEYDTNSQVDSTKFWSEVDRRRSPKRHSDKVYHFGDKMVNEPKEVLEGWREHLSKLYTPIEDPSFCHANKQSVDEKLEEYKVMSMNEYCRILDEPIVLAEVMDCIKDLPKNKACGPDNVYNEHLIHGGTSIARHIWILFCMIEKCEHIPKDLQMGLTIMLPKVKGKAKLTADNHRGITLLTCILKLYEKVKLRRFLQWKDDTDINFPDISQCAYQKRLNSLHASYSLQQCVDYNTKRGSNVYVCLLDSSKAFDLVWHEGLFVKVFELGVKGKWWRLLVKAYSTMTSAVSHAGLVSEYFPVLQSVRQGGVLSPWLYLIYINEMLVSLRESGHGAGIGDIYCGTAAQADDVALLALSPKSLQVMLNISYEFSCTWRSIYNALKTIILVYGETKAKHMKNRMARKWFLGEKAIVEGLTAKHVGVHLNTDRKHNISVEKASQCGRKAFLGLVGAGVRPRGLNPITSSRLYKVIVLPRFLYGCELWTNLSQKNLIQLETVNRFCIKQMQGLSIRTRSVIALGLLGLYPIELEIDRRKLTFWANTHRLPEKSLAKKVMNQTMEDESNDYAIDIRRILRKYKLSDVMVASEIPSKYTWKLTVKKAIDDYHSVSQRDLVIDDIDFRVYSHVMEPASVKPYIGWRLVRDVKSHRYNLVFLIMSLVSSGAVCPILCEHCGLLSDNQLHHFLLECPTTGMARRVFWGRIERSCGNVVTGYLNNLPVNEVLAHMYGGGNLCEEVKTSIVLSTSELLGDIRQYLDATCPVYKAFRWVKR